VPPLPGKTARRMPPPPAPKKRALPPVLTATRVALRESSTGREQWRGMDVRSMEDPHSVYRTLLDPTAVPTTSPTPQVTMQSLCK